MSKNNTITSAVSEVLPQQQKNLQQLQTLENRTRSLVLTPTEYSPLYLQHLQQEQLQQQQAGVPRLSNDYSINDTDLETTNVLPKNMLNNGAPIAIDNETVTNGHVFHKNLAVPIEQHNVNSVHSISSNTGKLTQTTIHPHKSSQQQVNDPRSPLVILVPTNSQPTEILAQRFTAWRSVIKSLINYLSEIASIQDEIVRQQLRLTHSISFPFFAVENLYQPSSNEDKSNQKFFLPLGNGSIQDLPTILNQYHGSLASNASKASKELSGDVIPRLEDLRRDLLVKIKEIKFLQSDFKNSCSKELQKTKIDLKNFLASVEQANLGTPKQDPYITKIVLDRQIKKQITEENFLHEAYDNLENSASELEKVVVMEIQNALTIFARLSGQQSQIVFDILISKLDSGFFNKDPGFEWNNFISRDPNFITPNSPLRKMNSIVYKNQFDPLTYQIKSGFLEKRSKFLKSYSRGFYVLTPSFLHEFKTADRKRDLVPIISLPLNECTVAEHSKKDSTDYKFILHSKQNGLISRGHNWVFKADNYESMTSWYQSLKELTAFTDVKLKSEFVTKKLSLDTRGKPLSRVTTVSSANAQSPRSKNDENMNYNTTNEESNEEDAQEDNIPGIVLPQLN